jgi:hypothetical protein
VKGSDTWLFKVANPGVSNWRGRGTGERNASRLLNSFLRKFIFNALFKVTLLKKWFYNFTILQLVGFTLFIGHEDP